jgi:hypothetical protein
MRVVAYVSGALGVISGLIGMISRYTLTPIHQIPGGLEAEALLAFANTCFLFGILVVLLENSKK